MPTRSTVRAAALLAAGLSAAGLAGCQNISNALGGGSGVMPESDLGPPPSMRDKLPGKFSASPSVDEDGNPLPSTPTRQLALPKTVGAGNRTAEAGPRRISRDEIDGGNAAVGPGGSGSGGVGPSLSNGGVGVGGKF